MPVPVLNVAAETPLSLHGDTAERPSPAQNAIRTRDKAAAATAPAAIAGQDTAEGPADCASPIADAGLRSASICSLPDLRVVALITHVQSQPFHAPRKCRRLNHSRPTLRDYDTRRDSGSRHRSAQAF